MPGSGRKSSSLERSQQVNKVAAVVVPIIICGIVGFTIWVVVVLLCGAIASSSSSSLAPSVSTDALAVNYLLKPGPETNVQPRPGAAIAIIVIFFLLLLPMSLSYFRTMHIAVADPGVNPIGPKSDTLVRTFVEEPYYEFDWPCAAKTPATPEKEAAKRAKIPGRDMHTLDLDAIFRGDIAAPPGMDAFYSRDVFQCDPNGLPIWCGTCRNWKPDRAHHSSDAGRCVANLDHFCPWVGGLVGERNIKFFVQFNVWTALFTAFVTIVLAIFVAEVRAQGGGRGLNAAWIVDLALGALFCLFTGGMAGNSIAHAVMALTTVDAIDHTRRTVFLAVRLRDGKIPDAAMRGQNASAESVEAGDGIRDLREPWQGTIAFPFYVKGQEAPARRETFAILVTPPGVSPWNLGAYRNWKGVMGERVLDWFSPFKRSPCCDHSRRDSMYPMGPAYHKLLTDAGIRDPRDRSRHKRRRRHHSQRSEDSP